MPNLPNRNGDVLPELTPEMFSSYGAMRELEGAVASRGTPVYQNHRDTPSGEVAGWLDDNIPPPPVDTFEVSFDTSELDTSEVTSFRAPAQGARFNVLRPPAHEPFRPPPPVPGPQGGNMREVGRVGRFQILSDAAPESATPDYLSEARARLEDRRARQEESREVVPNRRPTATEVNSKQREYRAAVHETLPTAYDRLMGEDPYEDDLE